MIIGISGKSGVGKSLVSKYIANKLNYKVIDVDKLSEIVRNEYRYEIIKMVGNEKILNDDIIDSKLLGNILFDNKELMREYNLFIYDKLKKILIEEIESDDNIIIDTIFLPIMDIFSECDFKILIICDDEVRKARIYDRDKVGVEYINKRDKNSIEYNYEDFDLIVDNTKDFISEVDNFISKIKS